MIKKAAALAKIRVWDFDILSPLHLAVAIPSPRWGFFHAVDIYCSIDGGVWGFVMLKEFSILCERNEDVGLAIRRLRPFFSPAEFEILPEPNCFIRCAVDLEIEDDVENHLGRAIDEALAQFDMAWTVLQLVNWGNKSPDEAIACVNKAELQELRGAQSNGKGKAG